MDALELLLERRSASRLMDPGPGPDDLDTIMRAALRAPDHGQLRPWEFILIRGAARESFGDLLAAISRSRDPQLPEKLHQREREKPLRAPLIMVVVHRGKPSAKIPESEQLLSAAAATQNILLAAHALGYGAVWKTGAAAYDTQVKRHLGVAPDDAIVGFIHIGTLPDDAMQRIPPRSLHPADFLREWHGWSDDGEASGGDRK